MKVKVKLRFFEQNDVILLRRKRDCPLASYVMLASLSFAYGKMAKQRTDIA